MKKKSENSKGQDWGLICNMRTTLLHLQYIYNEVSEKLEHQQINVELHQKDRLLQMRELLQENKQINEANFKVLLIVKLESMLAIYEPINNAIWQRLNSFLNYVEYCQEEMARDACRLYIGNQCMIDIGKCEKELQKIGQSVKTFLQDNSSVVAEYNLRMKQLDELTAIWTGYLREVNQFINKEVQPRYIQYLRRRLAKKQEQLNKSITVLKELIRS